MTGKRIELALQELLDKTRKYAGKISDRYAFYMPPKMVAAYCKHLNFGRPIHEELIECYIVTFCGYRVYSDAKLKKDIITLENRVEKFKEDL